MTASRELTLPAVTDAAEIWQRRLRLQDWDVKFSLGRMSALDVGTLGDCEVSSTKRQARIRLLDPRDVDGQAFWFDGEAWDWEITLVHELLHLHFHDIFPDGWPHKAPAGTAGERTIDAVAKALVALARKDAA
jgi:hypothetical protein